MKLKDITTPKITELMQSYKLNPATVRKVYIVIQSIFHRGVEQGFIRETPCHNVILPKNKVKKKTPVLDEKQTKRFMELLENKSIDGDVRRIIKVLLYTGMRIGECLGLSWDDIDFDNRIISVNHTLTYSGKNSVRHLTVPKTESSIRTLGMSSMLSQIFKEQKEYVEQLSSAVGSNFEHPEMVFPSALGNYRDRKSVYTSLKRLTKGTEFEGLTLHKLRHVNATLLLNNGVDLKVVSEHLGHCDIGVTANIYADVLKSTKAKVADLVELHLT